MILRRIQHNKYDIINSVARLVSNKIFTNRVCTTIYLCQLNWNHMHLTKISTSEMSLPQFVQLFVQQHNRSRQ